MPGCERCEGGFDPEAPYPKAGTGLPGLIFVLEKKMGHQLAEFLTEEQIARGLPCRDPEHAEECMYVTLYEYEAVGPCPTCNPFWRHPDERAKERLDEEANERARRQNLDRAKREMEAEETDHMLGPKR